MLQHVNGTSRTKQVPQILIVTYNRSLHISLVTYLQDIRTYLYEKVHMRGKMNRYHESSGVYELPKPIHTQRKIIKILNPIPSIASQ